MVVAEFILFLAISTPYLEVSMMEIIIIEACLFLQSMCYGYNFLVSLDCVGKAEPIIVCKPPSMRTCSPLMYPARSLSARNAITEATSAARPRLRNGTVALVPSVF